MAKKEPKRTRDKRITLRFSDEEYQYFKQKKEKAKAINYTDFVLKAVSDMDIFVLDVKPVLQTLTELNRIGNNINQIAKVTNETRNIYKNEVKILQEKLENIKFIVSGSLRGLTKINSNKSVENIIKKFVDDVIDLGENTEENTENGIHKNQTD